MEATDPRALTLAMHDYEVPCVMQLTEFGCENKAEWLATFKHLAEGGCDIGPPMPICETHRAMMVPQYRGFWADYLGTANPPCDNCGKPYTLDSVEPIKPNG